MTTAFEFLQRDSRQIHVGRRAPIAFLVATVAFVVVAWWLSSSASSAQREYTRQADALRKRQTEFASQAAAALPSSAQLDDLEMRLTRHNEMMIGRQVSWTRLFALLEDALPSEAIIVKIENALTGDATFNAGDNHFKMTVAVENADAVNMLYMNLSTMRGIEGLSFTPKGDVTTQGRASTIVEVVFQFREGD
ncbi:MAG TPA: hypothetical protein PLU72_01310 [Candidatus Ozemobacteraceae bacterium]|nr:hypothetical protein [Candidatus Ozemobacteraceae bacterium]HQG27956.1 hypothetical protein [Candidatus Ozemobacteraceae bacterium]